MTYFYAWNKICSISIGCGNHWIIEVVESMFDLLLSNILFTSSYDLPIAKEKAR
jgi:hypothetical protein